MEKSIGQKIREARTERKMTQAALAEKIGYSRSHLSHWENDNGFPDEEALARLEEVLECGLLTAPENEDAGADSVEAAPVAAPAILRRKIPLWMGLSVVAGVFVIMLAVIFGVTAHLQAQLDALMPDAPERFSLAWYQQEDKNREDGAHLRIWVEPDPVKMVYDGQEYMKDAWFYTIYIAEENGVDFAVEEMVLQDFNGENTVDRRTYSAKTLTDFFWGTNIIFADYTASFRGGITVEQAMTNSGILIRGTDANGNAREFRGIINYSYERAD